MEGPNFEQLQAICHNGGKLLEAGAGSGKTYVVVEHILYILKGLIQNFDKLGGKETIKEQLSQIVLLSFTRNATKEIQSRLKTKIYQEWEICKECTERKNEKIFWELILENFDIITVTTIHGLCYKLIKLGYLQNINPEIKIIEDHVQKKKISLLFQSWFERSRYKKILSDTNLVEIFLTDHLKIKESLVSIFQDSYLRYVWAQNNNGPVFSWSEYFIQLQEHYNGFQILHYPLSLQKYMQFAHQQWFILVNDFQVINQKFAQDGANHFFQLMTFFAKISRIPPLGKEVKEDEVVLQYWNSFKEIKTFFKDNAICLQDYKNQEDDKYLQWTRLLLDCIQYIEKQYLDLFGMSYSDLEYYLFTSLEQDPTLSKKIREQFSYFVVDEFQDTSYIQYHILRHMIGGDYSKLFCIGDIKQAIYGFRGGELAVFLDCKKNVQQCLTLVNNYRSDEQIIEFNNSFFKYLFASDECNTESEKIGFVFHPQIFPESKIVTSDSKNSNVKNGSVIQINAIIPEKQNAGKIEKMRSFEINSIEANVIYSYILHLLKNERSGNIAILYKNMSPSLLLIERLLEQGIGFTAQIKIPVLEDPIMGIFLILLENVLDEKTRLSKELYVRGAKVIIELYLQYLRIPIIERLEDRIKSFYIDISYMGIFESYKKFTFALGLVNSQYKNNMLRIKDVCSSSFGKNETIWQSFKNLATERYSLSYQFGMNPEKIQIMSAHSSKGLEFENVLLGGLYTNGQNRFDNEFIGKTPGSFKWRSINKEMIKTPQFILEDLISYNKSISESKRLFYVACTRAQKTLAWVGLKFNELSFIIPKNSWILELQKYLLESYNPSSSNIDQVDFNCSIKALDQKFRMPLFHRDSLGISAREDTNKAREYALFSELSVTKLASIADCPRKFYLKNICKFSEEDLGLLKNIHQTSKLGYTQNVSSAERGTQIHQFISQALKSKDFSINNLQNKLDDVDFQKIEWVFSDLVQYIAKYSFISEQTIKFSIYGHMITGTPDLVLLSKMEGGQIIEKSDCIIIDFKTGKQNEYQENSYWAQLILYAFGISRGQKYQCETYRLQLIYIDEKKVIEKKYSALMIEEFVGKHWLNMAKIDQVNPKYCPHCEYHLICRPDIKSYAS